MRALRLATGVQRRLGVDDRWEWEPSLLAMRRDLEACFEFALMEAVPRPVAPAPEEMDLALRAIADADDAPSLSRYLEREATFEQLLEFIAHRSAYQLKEADPHSWALPRLYGPPKAALVQIQADEYGGGVAERIHAQLFADTMDALGLDSRYGAYLDHLPAVTLATVNLMSLFGLHRRWRGAIVGHLALFEMESSVPNRRYASGLRRLGCGPRATAFFDEHVLADAIHESVAAVDLAGGLARQQPGLADDILWGAATLVELDARFARHTLAAWELGVSSLRLELSEPLAALMRRPSSPGGPTRELHGLLRATRRAEADDLVRSVAERLGARPAAATQRDRLAARVDRVAVLVLEAKPAAHDQGAVTVGGDAGFGHTAGHARRCDPQAPLRHGRAAMCASNASVARGSLSPPLTRELRHTSRQARPESALWPMSPSSQWRPTRAR